MTGWEPGYGKNFFDTMDYLASNWMLPLGGLFIALYAGWVMPRQLPGGGVRRHPGRSWSSVPGSSWSASWPRCWSCWCCSRRPAFVDADEVIYHLFP